MASENSVRKGENIANQLIFICPQRTFVILCITQSRLLMTLKKKPFENIVGKGENAG